MTVRLDIVTDRMKGLIDSLERLVGHQVLVGVPSDTEQPHYGQGQPAPNKRLPEPGKTQPAVPITNALIGYWHTHGVPSMGIPPRPHLEQGIQRAEHRINQRLLDAADAAMDGELSRVLRNLHAVGLEAQSSIRRYLQQGVPPPLKPATVARRRKRTKGSSYRRKAATPGETKPLIDTAQYLRSLTYILRDVPRRLFGIF